MDLRPAATVMLLREAAAGLEVFMVRRSSRSRFLPEAYVFPGGTLEQDDFAASERLHEGVAVCQHPDCTLDARTQRALFATALREVAEECGVHFGDASELSLFSHWTTPQSERQRYEVHFFVAPLPHGQEAAPDTREADEGIWIAPERALARGDAESMLLYYPTRKHLERLAKFRTAKEALEFARSKPIVTVLPSGSREEGFALPFPVEDSW